MESKFSSTCPDTDPKASFVPGLTGKEDYWSNNTQADKVVITDMPWATLGERKRPHYRSRWYLRGEQGSIQQDT